MLDVYEIITYFLAAAGLWKLLSKCGKKGWYGLIPGFRYYKLAECAEMEMDGLVCLLLEIASRVSAIFMNRAPENSTSQNLWIVISLGLVLVLFVYQIRIGLGVIRLFDLSRKWIVLIILFPWLAFILIGFVKKYQPVQQKVHNDTLAGTAPAALRAAVDTEKSSDGLVIHIHDRTVKNFGKLRYLLKDINLTIPNGSLVLLLGGSGSGKTTMVNAINGYEKANATVLLNGEDIYKDYEKMKYRIGFVPQQELLRMNDTVEQTLGDASKLRLPVQVKEEERQKKIENVCEVLGLSGGLEGLVGKKSGGMKKRISIGTELISDPELFILDEPDSGLDGVIARELFTKLRDIADTGRIVIAITHTPDRVIDLFDKVIVLARDSGNVGRLAFFGSPEEARKFFEKDTMEQIVMAINGKNAGGEDRADEFIEKYAEWTLAEREVKADEN